MQQHSLCGLTQAALSCSTVVQGLMDVLGPTSVKLQAEAVGRQCTEQCFSLAPQQGFLPAVCALLATSGDHLPPGMSSQPMSLWSNVGNTAPGEPHSHLFARLSQDTLLISTARVLIQGLLTTPTVLKEYL